jgi:hypothetical protein
MTDIDIDERRGKVRYPVKDSSAVLLSPDNIISYALLDISESGLAFAYNGPGTEVTLMSSGQIDLFGEVILVSDMKIKIISDTPMTSDDISESPPYLRRCGVQFVKMPSKQNKIISNYLSQLNG